MLLRLLPAPTAAQANPPTILFTLSMPAHPYTAKSLPLPANLLAHKTVCLQEDLDCPNVLLGEKSSWLQGIITDVTFSLTDRSVSIELVDGSKTCHAVSSECEKMLRQVCREVELSLVPARTSSESSRSSIEVAGPSRVAMKRTPSSLLYSLISPLLPTANYQSSSARAVAMNRAPPARLHRRAARSILVDTFRRFILPTLKAQMPSAYLPWAANLEIERRLAEFTELQKSIDTLLAGCQVKWSPRTPLRRFRTCAGSMMSEDSDSEYSGCESTPATSIFSDVGDKNPHNYLAACPPAQCVPTELQAQYTRLLSHVGDLAARIQSLKRLNAKFSREEGKRSWLDTLERGRIADKALKRALSNGELTRERCKREGIHVEPMTRSRLFRSWTAADQERKEAEQEASIHPAMLDVGMVEDATEDRDRNDDDSEEEEESDSEREDEMPITPTQVLFGRPQHISLPSPSGRDMDTEGHPSLTSSMSSDSLDADAYDEIRTPETEAGPPFGLFSKIAPAFAEPDVADAETAPWSEPANSLDLAMGNIHIDAKPAVPSRPRRRPIPNHLLSAA